MGQLRRIVMQVQEQSNTCLVISRNQGQSFVIGNDISIEIHRVQGKRVSVKIHAPKDVRILRSELKSNLTN